MKSLTSIAYKILTAFMIVILALTAMPVSSAFAATIEIIPTADGTYATWDSGDFSDINEGIAAADCQSNDSIIDNDNNDRDSFVIPLASVPNGSTITDINVRVAARGDNTAGGKYATFVRFNGANSANSATHATTSGSGACGAPLNDAFYVTDTVKNGATTLEVGVIKLNSGGATNNTVRVGALSVVITYTDSVAPTVTNVDSTTAAGSYNAGDPINVRVTFSEVLLLLELYLDLLFNNLPL